MGKVALTVVLILGMLGWAGCSSAILADRSCPEYDDVVDRENMEGFDIDRYQGIWYVAAHDEPTQPPFCKCDIFNWTITSDTDYSNHLSADCGPVKLDGPIVGKLSTDPANQGDLLEGWPPVFPLIPTMILYVEPDGESEEYTACIRYACKEDYWVFAPPFYYPLFESVQIYTREKVASQEKLDRLVQKAVDLGIVTDPTRLKNLTYQGCDAQSVSQLDDSHSS